MFANVHIYAKLKRPRNTWTRWYLLQAGVSESIGVADSKLVVEICR